MSLKLNINNLTVTQKLNLLKDKDCNYSILEELSNDNNFLVLSEVVNHQKCTFFLIKKVYSNNRGFIRCWLVLNRKLPKYIFDILEDHDFNIVKEHLTYNKYSTESVLVRLFKEFPRQVLSNPNCPDYLKVLSI